MEAATRGLIIAATAAVIALFATIVDAADNSMTVAVFTKNLTNPAYEAFRIASDKIARLTGAKVVHYVPKRPDDVDEQKAMVD
jgi:ribose transport system substrate-binding protein